MAGGGPDGERPGGAFANEVGAHVTLPTEGDVSYETRRIHLHHRARRDDFRKRAGSRHDRVFLRERRDEANSRQALTRFLLFRGDESRNSGMQRGRSPRLA